jgi:GNAT superfamily N-acetyltransferase
VIDIRTAEARDLTRFLSLWRCYLAELHEAYGGEILPTERTMTFFTDLFMGLLGGDRGVCLLAEDDGRAVGTLLWGSLQQPPVDTSLGRTAQGWGTYVVPDARGRHVASQLRYAGAKALLEMGFEHVVGAAEKANDAGLVSGTKAGFRIVQQIGVLELRGGQ